MLTSADAAEALLMAVAMSPRATDAASTLAVMFDAPAPTWLMIPVRSPTALLVSELAFACSEAPEATWLIVWAIWLDAVPD